MLQALDPVRMSKASALSREFMLLCHVISGDPARERIKDMLQEPFDWMAMAHLAERHGVRPQLLRGLRRIGLANLPPEAKQLLEDFQKLHAIHCLRLGGELLGIADLLEAKRVRFATFKGIALALSLYEDILSREVTDIDLIIHRVRSGNRRSLSAILRISC